MKTQRRAERILLLVIVGLAMAALMVLYVTAPPPTILTVRVIDAETGAPLPGARVEARPRNGAPLAAAFTDDAGIARFENAPPDPAYSIQVQKVDYELSLGQSVSVPEGRTTEFAVSLTPHAGDRLFVGLDRSRVARIDAASLLPIETLVLPGASEAPVRHLLVHPDRNLVYAVAGMRGYILDGTSGATLGRLVISDTVESLDLSVDGQHLYVSGVEDDYASGLLSRVHLLTLDARSGELVTDTLLTEISPAMQVAWTPTGSRPEVLEAVLRGPENLGYIPVRSTLPRAGAVLSADGKVLFTWVRAYSSEREEMFDMLTIDPIEGGVMWHQDLPAGTTALAASPTKEELYVLNGQMGTLTILDWTGTRPRTLVAVGKQPDALSISRDGKWAYVGNRESQTISAIDLDSASVVLTIDVPGMPLSIAVR
jgi:YVTN family beta-propeller protein